MPAHSGPDKHNLLHDLFTSKGIGQSFFAIAQVLTPRAKAYVMQATHRQTKSSRCESHKLSSSVCCANRIYFSFHRTRNIECGRQGRQQSYFISPKKNPKARTKDGAPPCFVKSTKAPGRIAKCCFLSRKNAYSVPILANKIVPSPCLLFSIPKPAKIGHLFETE